tara:strand:- start:3212 stop:3907 length:696 start_codon:yes stop_codon:yes gene_type:complete
MNEKVYERIIDNLSENKINVIGIHGPQGIGKTTLKKYLENKLNEENIDTVILSLDDFYLEYQSMKSFLKYANNSSYKFRGLAGTHDIDLLYTVLNDLLKGNETYMPIFDKKLENSFGDRSGYAKITIKPKLIILEGWMIGYKPLDNPSNKVAFFNHQLYNYEPIQNLIDYYIYLDTIDLQYIYQWRWDAEDKNGMDLDTFDEFMKPYMLIYENYNIKDENKIIVDFNRNII